MTYVVLSFLRLFHIRFILTSCNWPPNVLLRCLSSPFVLSSSEICIEALVPSRPYVIATMFPQHVLNSRRIFPHTHTHSHTRTFTHTLTHAHTHTVHTHTHAHSHSHTHARTRAHAHTHTHISVTYITALLFTNDPLQPNYSSFYTLSLLSVQ